MNPELDALIKAFEDVVQASDDDDQRLRAIYEARLSDLVERTGIARDLLHKAIETRHAQWVKANQRPPSIPPQA